VCCCQHFNNKSSIKYNTANIRYNIIFFIHSNSSAFVSIHTLLCWISTFTYITIVWLCAICLSTHVAYALTIAGALLTSLWWMIAEWHGFRIYANNNILVELFVCTCQTQGLCARDLCIVYVYGVPIPTILKWVFFWHLLHCVIYNVICTLFNNAIAWSGLINCELVLSKNIFPFALCNNQNNETYVCHVFSVIKCNNSHKNTRNLLVTILSWCALEHFSL
jgi:hypothetical protein